MNTIAHFIELRMLILKNAIYNRILTATLAEEETFCVASTLEKLRPETKSELKKDVNRKRLPTYAMYDIFVKVNESDFSIGLKYEDHNIIWDHPKVSFETLKHLSDFIFRKYSITPVKSDKIFSTLPNDVSRFFSANSYSPNEWKMGFPKRQELLKTEKVNWEIIDEYFEELTRRNAEYRAFNKILINVIKKGRYYRQTHQGSISVKKSTIKNSLNLTFFSEYDWQAYSETRNFGDFSPTQWNVSGTNVYKNTIVSMLQ